METRISVYSEQNLLRKFDKGRMSGSLLKLAYKSGVEFDVEILDFSNPDCGRYISLSEMKRIGFKNVLIRFNSDRSIVSIPL